VVGAGMVICLQQGADLHISQLMPLPLTVSCFSKIQIGFTFLVPAHLGSPGKGPLNGCVFHITIATVRLLVWNTYYLNSRVLLLHNARANAYAHYSTCNSMGSTCLSEDGIESKELNGLNWFSAQRLVLTHPTPVTTTKKKIFNEKTG